MPFLPSSKSLLGKAMRLPLRLIPRGAVVPILSGPARGVKWTVGSATHGTWLGIYERTKQQLFQRSIRPGSVVFDIGAHVGIYSLIAARTGAKVFAFEPLPRNLRFLRKHIELNELEGVTVIDAAVADRCGTAAFAVTPASEMGALSESGVLTVNIVAIDELVARGELPKPDVIKMDIEGGEIKALAGMHETLTTARPMLFLATHSDRINAECFPLLKSLGYAVSPIDGETLKTTREVVAKPS